MEASKAYYTGIDYSNGLANREGEYHYGVISQNSVDCEALNDFEPDYGDPSCPKCGGRVIDFEGDSHDEFEQYSEWGCAEYACENCEVTLDGADVYGDEPIGFSYDVQGYKAYHGTDGFGVWVTRSPYFTYATYCSPCAPGAGDLDSPLDVGVGPKTFCFGHEFFEDGKAPYAVFSVETQLEVSP